MKSSILTIFYIISFTLQSQIIAQPIPPDEIQKMINDFKKDERGPYQAIRWFCSDGTNLPPKEKCPEPGGIQHAIVKDIVNKLAQSNKIYLGQILAGTDFNVFWDEANGNSRIKQYILEQYLYAIDEGWIMRKGRYYRGAIQAEDEADWGYRFLSWLVTDDINLKNNYFLIRQAFRSIPHNAADKLWDRIRSVSKVLSDSIESFTPIRIKLHGQPGSEDLEKVQNFRLKNKSKITPIYDEQFNQLEKDLREAYQPVSTENLERFLKMIPKESTIYKNLERLINSLNTSAEINKQTLTNVIQLMWQCRKQITTISKNSTRMAIFDLSILLESLMFQYNEYWTPHTIHALFDKANTLVMAAAACGFLEIWEYEKIKPLLQIDSLKNITTMENFLLKTEYIKRSVEWGSSMAMNTYKNIVNTYSEFEPISAGFVDDRIRISPLLQLGLIAGQIADLFAIKTGITNDVLNIPSQNKIRGINSGYALAELEIINSVSEKDEYDPNKIYILAQSPADLKPVAGILTVSEGNMVSHVQLLARNLGIPNAVITQDCLEELRPYSGKKVFYAVSGKGSVIMKLAKDMSNTEKDLFKIIKSREDKFTVPIDKIDISETHPINLQELRADDSGIFTGPKAANLGELKHLFPENVVKGFALPFGVYREHLKQIMPGTQTSYREFIQESFNSASKLNSEKETEVYILERLAKLREAIKNISLLPEFTEDVSNAFIEIFGKPMGAVPVFVRSDTNMEDLKDFTGAGLNLTVFNVLDKNAIFQAIRDVWASPFSERSYRWRQRLLLNPENVYPSILIIPTVNNDKSGVMITTGIYSGNKNDITVAFNRGSGGAVEGQIAESYTIENNGKNLLLAPCRELEYLILPDNGGTKKVFTTLETPILSKNDLNQLADFSTVVKTKIKGKKGFEISVPLDIELGFKNDKIWLFQVRPFVESKKAKTSEYLNNIDPDINKQQTINLDEVL